MGTMGFVAFHWFDEPNDEQCGCGMVGSTCKGRSMALNLRDLCLELGALEDAIGDALALGIPVLAIVATDPMTYRELTSDEQTEWDAFWKDPANRSMMELEEAQRVLSIVDGGNLTEAGRDDLRATQAKVAADLAELRAAFRLSRN
jgi:hypothetical protein